MGPFWTPRLAANHEATLPAIYHQLKKTGRFDAFDLDGNSHIFWDSDVAKYVEAAGYDLVSHPDASRRRQLDGVVARIMKAQQPDGYLNTYYTLVNPRARWSNLRDAHELYCAGHLIEAALAYLEATGREDFLGTMCRYADLIDNTFGRGRGKKRGYPGHQEIELALVRLYRVTGEERYLNLALYFIEERGRKPLYFEREARDRGEDPKAYRFGTLAYQQAHLPVREQTEAVGHAVRAMYMYSAMADLSRETGDATLFKALKPLWDDVCHRKMYLTGGVGSSSANEGFTGRYDLPEEDAYAETCASVALVFWCHRMLQHTNDGRYADIMERALYNGVISGVSLDGSEFFYANPMVRKSKPPEEESSIWDGSTYGRRPWFGCACCPTNLARLLASLGGYVYSTSPKNLWVHLYTGGDAVIPMKEGAVSVRQTTRYPWDGRITLRIDPERECNFTLRLRIPGWCPGARIEVGGEQWPMDDGIRQGYASIQRRWREGDRVELLLDMPPECIHAHPDVKQARGKTALMRGPLVYCLEEADHPGAPLERFSLTSTGLRSTFRDEICVLKGHGAWAEGWKAKEPLYRTGPPKTKPARITAVPYYTWANRGHGAMRIWLD